MKFLKAIVIITALIWGGTAAWSCTSMVVSGRASASGRPMLWKNRDTSQAHNFVERCEATDSTMAYVALYNGGDSTLAEAWAGVNSSGFAVMNTASYNLQPDTASYCDREAYVMSEALRRCRSVEDFERLLRSLPKPNGVQANFGVIDAFGGAAVFEIGEEAFARFDAEDTADGCLIRTNYSVSGYPEGGYGYIRAENARHILGAKMEAGTLTPIDFIDGASKSYYHSVFGRDLASSDTHWLIDQDFIPRYTTTASIVIEGVNNPVQGNKCVMWAALGYPPCSVTRKASVEYVPDELRPLRRGYRSADSNRALELKAKAFPIHKGNGEKYIDMDFVRAQLRKR